MSETRQLELSHNEIAGISLMGYRETPYYSTLDGQLCQWIEVDMQCTEGWRRLITFEIASGGHTARRTLGVRKGEFTLRCAAPAIWPAPPDPQARLIVTCEAQTAAGTIAIGSHRPWTLYLLSDCCADDTWAYADLDQHDRDDYRTTLAELNAAPDNSYNYPSVYQIARFFQYATTDEQAALGRAFQEGRFYLSPIPNQLLCGAFTLGAYPLILEPYRHWCGRMGLASFPDAAYHMEAPTWTNGLVNLLACAGFRVFGKSLLRFLSPWLDALETLPALTRLQVAPERYVYLILRCNNYDEGHPILAGQPQVSRLLHEQLIPRYEALGEAHPSAAIPIVGLYSDLHPELPDYASVKVAAVRDYNAQEWEYPRLVNGTWAQFAQHIQEELGQPECPARDGLRTVRGDTGGAWEGWMMSALAEMGRFRAAQRGVVSIRALQAMLGCEDAALQRTIQETVLETVELGDHAWNGSSEASKQLNLSIRQNRLALVERNLAAIRASFRRDKPRADLERLAVVNTLGWARTCRVDLPDHLASHWAYLTDPETGECFPILHEDDTYSAIIPDVPGFGQRTLEARRGLALESPPATIECPLDREAMRPLLNLGDERVAGQGGWEGADRGRWEVGPFEVTARLRPLRTGEGTRLELDISGTPPADPYELRWSFELPWDKAMWRGESGGGFTTPGPTEGGGDSLLGITGSIMSCGEGLCASAPDGRECIDFAFDQTGLCGLGGRSTHGAQGTYGERLDAEVVHRSVWDSTLTAGRLELYLLGNQQNHREALLDQGGTRHWHVRCALQRRVGAFDDAGLYRFACGLTYPAEIVDPDLWPDGSSWLALGDEKGILPLQAFVDGSSVCLDVYNTRTERASFRLAGRAAMGRTIGVADMLCRATGHGADGTIAVEPLSFLRVRME